MNLILYLLITGLILTNLIGLGLAVSRKLPHFVLALNAGIIGLVLLLFFIEHFFGLGKIFWLWPLLTVAATWSLYANRALILSFQRGIIAFSLAFAYALAWRLVFPDISPTSENITDLFFISNYLPGVTLPPPDNWLPPHRFDYYYAIIHYAAGLLGRLFGLDAGTTYQFAMIILHALLISTAWFIVDHFCAGRRYATALVMCAFVLGGTGISPLYHFLVKGDNSSASAIHADATSALWANARFIGLYEERINTEFGKSVIPPLVAANGVRTPDLPVVTLAHWIYIGDYHADRAGMLLLLLGIACIALLERKTKHANTDESAKQAQRLQGLMALTIPLTLAANTWTFPTQALLVGIWIAVALWRKQKPDWKALGSGLALGFLLLLPFLAGFSQRSKGVTWVWMDASLRASVIKVLVVMWPLLVLTTLALFQTRVRAFALIMCSVIIIIFGMTELGFVNDANGGIYSRFNTTLKWWSWIYAIGIVGLGAVNLSADSKIIRWGTVTTLLLVSTHGYDLARHAIFAPKTSVGKLSGHHWLSHQNNFAVRDMITWLRAQPQGISLESMQGGAYSSSTALSLFAGQPVLMGWPEHLRNWKGDSPQSRLLQNDINEFFTGNKPECISWLYASNVQYVIWNTHDNKDPATWAKLNAAISPQYYWKPFYDTPDFKLGMWTRR